MENKSQNNNFDVTHEFLLDVINLLGKAKETANWYENLLPQSSDAARSLKNELCNFEAKYDCRI